jgi:predicted methyltransferase
MGARIIGAALLATTLVASLAHASPRTAPYIAAAVADPGRPAADTARDAARKPAQILSFAGVKPGETMLEILPGGGYFTRMFSKAVGPRGHVFAAVPPAKSSDAEPAAAAIAASPGYGNVSIIDLNAAAMTALPKLDLIWTSQNYHDLHLSRVHTDVPALDRLWFSLLKKGGVVVIEDHVALAGSPATETADKLHRIDPAIVRQEMEGAGFVFDGETDVLRNPADPHTALIFDPSIRGRTDQFVYRFRKP